MKISPLTSNYQTYQNSYAPKPHHSLAFDTVSFSNQKHEVSFKGSSFNPIKKITGYLEYRKAQKFADHLYEYVQNNKEEKDNFFFRKYNMDALEGIQYNLKAFEGLTMKEIQYLSEFLHVIAVKRGCNHMCGHCYADARPSNREMSYEDFHEICKGFKTLRERLHGLDIFAGNISLGFPLDDIYKTTELFYDADCMNIVIKDKKGKEYDFCDLSKELTESLGRVTVFDTAGWDLHNKKLQARAEKYAKHFSNPENMKQLEQFNFSFNIFNASYIASRKALKEGDKAKSERLREKFVKNAANTLFTFTPLLNQDKYKILLRAFSDSEKTAKGFTSNDLGDVIKDVLKELERLYLIDLSGEQKYVKTESQIKYCLSRYIEKMWTVDNGLNSAGRMLDFMKEHKISTKNMQDIEQIGEAMKKSLENKPRFAKTIAHRFIDADGKVYHMTYAKFIPTEVQLNLDGKDIPTPKLANLIEDFVITKKALNDD